MAMPDDLTTLVCLFHTDDQAKGALNDLHAAGITERTVSVIRHAGSDPAPYSGATLQSLGVPERDQKHLADGLRDGGVLLAVDTYGPQQKAVEDIFTNHKAKKIDDQRLDEYDNYKKYKDETQEHPPTFPSMAAGAGAAAGAGYQPESLLDRETASSGQLVAEPQGTLTEVAPDGTVVVKRLIHVYRRDSDDETF